MAPAVGVAEAPPIYRRDDVNSLVAADGGTSWQHQATVARPRALFGPYETALVSRV